MVWPSDCSVFSMELHTGGGSPMWSTQPIPGVASSMPKARKKGRPAGRLKSLEPLYR